MLLYYVNTFIYIYIYIYTNYQKCMIYICQERSVASIDCTKNYFSVFKYRIFR
jgi:hypothetical protein